MLSAQVQGTDVFLHFQQWHERKREGQTKQGNLGNMHWFASQRSACTRRGREVDITMEKKMHMHMCTRLFGGL